MTPIIPGLPLFWEWVGERESIRQKRLLGDPWPWTEDPVLRAYKFTNVFRFHDRVTQELWERTRALPGGLSERLWHIVVHRLFNWTPTYDVLLREGLLKKWDVARAKRVLDRLRHGGVQLYTGAYMVRAEVSGEPKHRYYCTLIGQLWKGYNRGDWWGLLSSPEWSQQALHRELIKFRNVGGFVAYEMVTDLTYHLAPTDLNAWANAGPGAKRGLNRVYGREARSALRDDQALDEMLWIHAGQDRWRPKHVQRLTLRDVEHSLCEFDKWVRTRLGEGRPRSTYKPRVEEPSHEYPLHFFWDPRS